MALKNGKTLKTTLQIFFKENARYPEFNEFRDLVLGKNKKAEKKADEKQEQPEK